MQLIQPCLVLVRSVRKGTGTVANKIFFSRRQHARAQNVWSFTAQDGKLWKIVTVETGTFVETLKL